ncbi:MAG: DNA repair protein RadC [Anaerolineae bacterium]|nr:DNA repair protein RadC [Anaerolineae bacterium]
MTHYRIADLPAEERPLNRLREVGPVNVSTAELLACILQTGDALHQANTLLTELGGLEGLAHAEQCMLTDVPGIGQALATRLQAAMELGRRIVAGNTEERIQIRAPQDAANVVMPLIAQQEQEHFLVLFLDTRNRIVDWEVLYKGTLNSSIVRIAEVFRGAVRRHCAAIIVAHNHPSGDPSPSPEDIALTQRLVEAGKLMEVDVLDHMVVGRGRWVSLRERGLGWA